MSNFVWPIRIYYEDTDTGGMVYYANYLKYMERARTEWLRSIGIEQDTLIDEYAILFAVRKVSVDYLHPGLFNDQLEVLTEIQKLGRASIIFEQTIMRLHDNQKICQGEVKIVGIDADTKGIKVFPKPLYQHFVDQHQGQLV